jgi:hypothetical protein
MPGHNIAVRVTSVRVARVASDSSHFPSRPKVLYARVLEPILGWATRKQRQRQRGPSKTKFRHGVNHGGSGPEPVGGQVVHQVTDKGGGGEEKNVTHANCACPIHLAPLTTPTAAAASVAWKHAHPCN